MESDLDIIDGIGERVMTDGLDALTDPERYYLAISELEAEANNGSFDQFFSNSSGELTRDALDGLKAVGATSMAAIFQRAIDLFPNGDVPRDGDLRTQNEQLNDLSQAFTDYPDDLRTLLDQYARAHESEFFGPRTLLERWHARSARGAETRPPSVFKRDLDKEAIEDARLTDRKCPICAQPALEHRRICRRCGYPYGRAVRQL